MKKIQLIALLAVFLALAWAAPALAQEPALTPQAIADKLDEYQNHFEKFQTQYHLTYGTVERKLQMDSQFIPQDPPYNVTGEYAVDRKANLKFLSEIVTTAVDKTYTTKSLFDGKRGVRLVSNAPGDSNWNGGIIEGVPVELNDEDDLNGHWRPIDSAYWPIDGRSLASTIRDARKVTVEPDQLSGSQVIKVTLLVHTKGTVLLKGKELEYDNFNTYVLWLSPEHNLLPLRYEKLMVADGASAGSGPKTIKVNSDLREIAPGIWFPFHTRIYHVRLDQPIVIEAAVDSISIGQDAQVPSEIKFPDGSMVSDEIKKTKYTAGAQNTAIASTSVKAGSPAASLPNENPNHDLNQSPDESPRDQGHGSSKLPLLVIGLVMLLVITMAGFYIIKKRSGKQM